MVSRPTHRLRNTNSIFSTINNNNNINHLISQVISRRRRASSNAETRTNILPQTILLPVLLNIDHHLTKLLLLTHSLLSRIVKRLLLQAKLLQRFQIAEQSN